MVSMIMKFQNRMDAGRQLAKLLAGYANRSDVLVLALPRGGVPVAFEIAQSLNVPLDVFVVRKLGVPGHEELAMGAVATGGVRVLNEGLVRSLGIPDAVFGAVTEREQNELERREKVYRQGRPAPEVKGRTIILVDDGIATGSTMKAAIKALRQSGAGAIVVAVPTVALSTLREMRPAVDGFVSVMSPADFLSVGEWYEDFSQTSDEEVTGLLGALDRGSGIP